MKLQIYRGNDTKLISFDIDENTTFSETQMAEKQIACNVVLPFVLPVQLGDYIVHKGERYKINTVPEYGKSESDHSHKYNIVFESPVYSLHDKFLMHEGTDDFSYYGTATDHLRLMVDNINQIEQGWTLGTIEVTEPMNLDYNNHSCRTALTAIAEKFKLEFFLVGQQVNMVKALGADTGLVFEFGRGKGLYELNRKIADDKNVVTRVYAFGGSKNIDYTYRDKAKKLLFQEKYLEANVDLYGVKEGKYENAEIFPSRTGMVTAVIDKRTVIDTSIDFDINAHLQGGEKAKIVFKSGALANYEFEIWKYDHSKKAIYFNVFKDTNDYTLPNELNFPEVNAKYTLVNLRMPESYIAAAESKLKADTLAYLQENSVPRVSYGLKPDEKYIRDNGIQLRVGDRITLIDLKLPINATLRIATLSYPLVNEANIDVAISNFIPYTMQDRLVANAIDTKKEVKQVSRIQAEQARRNSINLYDLKDSVIDPTTDKYYTGKIATGSIESLYLAIGAKATNFNLSSVSFKPNYLGNPNIFTASAGELIHYDLNVPQAGFTWEMDPFTASNLVASNKYYLYAKISKSVLVGSWELSTEVKSAESVPGYYILQAGVLFPEKDGRRDNALTNGMVFIVGDQITAGRIKSIDEKNFFDLTDGQFNIGDAENGINFNLDGLGTTNFAGNVNIKGGITGGTLKVGDEAGINNAGVSGAIDNGDKSVWLWGGGTYANRGTAPFRALQDGTVFMKKARISGDIVIGFQSEMVSSGEPNKPDVYTSGWRLSSSAILNDANTVGVSGGNNFALIRGSSKYENNKETEFAFSTNLIPDFFGGQYAQTAYIRNKRPKLGVPGWGDDTTNIALELHAEGANNNTALLINKGDFQLNDGNMKIGSSVGISGTWDVRMGGGHFWRMTWLKGILVSAVDRGD